MLLTYPRIILPEVNTHCMWPKNSASSRAIPVDRRIKQVREEPFVPRYLGANKRGMQATDALSESEAENSKKVWLDAAYSSSISAQLLSDLGLHKQLANRVMEPYVYVTTIVSFTEPGNLFNLRVDEAAQDEFFELAECILNSYAKSKPKVMQPGEWHVPFGDRMHAGLTEQQQLLVSAARCARISYETHDGDFSAEKDLELAVGLKNSGHMSPFQHQAQAESPQHFWGKVATIAEMVDKIKPERALWDGTDVWWAQFRWWRMFRKTLKGENREEFSLHHLQTTATRINEQRFGEVRP